MTRNSRIIGTTGITGSGTSTAAAILAERGGLVICADKLAHEVMRKNSPAHAEIVEIFGAGIIGGDGEIDRRLLGAKVFGDKDALSRLEKIIHPRVIDRTREICGEIAERGYEFAVIDAPLLIESGMNAMCESVWLITAPDSARISRITARDKIDEAAAKRRIESRKGDDFLRAHADVIIENDGDEADLRTKIDETCLKNFNWLQIVTS